MKLPRLNNTSHYGYHGGLYAIPAMRGNSPEERSIDTQADQGQGDIYACVRGVGGGEPGSCGPCHCYLKYIKNGHITDSRGFFVQGPAQEWDTSGSCRLVKKNASDSDWKSATDVYDGMNGDQYGLLTNNCCTAAVTAANAVPGGGAPVNVYAANAGIGTVTNKCVIQ